MPTAKKTTTTKKKAATTKKSTARKPKDDPLVQYLIKDRKGTFVIQVPSSWKLTFSHVNPNSNGGGARDGHCIRVWQGTKLRAVYCDVTGFRDLSIPQARKVENEAGSATWSRDSVGNFSLSEERKALDTSWQTDEPDSIDFPS